MAEAKTAEYEILEIPIVGTSPLICANPRVWREHLTGILGRGGRLGCINQPGNWDLLQAALAKIPNSVSYFDEEGYLHIGRRRS